MAATSSTGASVPAAGGPDAVAGSILVFSLEWRRATRRPRLFIMNMVIPLLLVTPVALGAAPPQHAAAVYTVMFVLFGTFGSAIPLLRDAERGLVRRFSLTPVPAAAWLVGRSVAGALLDVVQLAPSLVVLYLAGPAVTRPLALPAVLGASLFIANMLGIWVAAVARSVAEGALFAAVSALMLVHASGVFRTPSPGSVGSRVEGAAPFRSLHESLLGVRAVDDTALVVFAFVAVVLTTAFAGPLLRSLASTDSR